MRGWVSGVYTILRLGGYQTKVKSRGIVDVKVGIEEIQYLGANIS